MFVQLPDPTNLLSTFVTNYRHSCLTKVCCQPNVPNISPGKSGTLRTAGTQVFEVKLRGESRVTVLWDSRSCLWKRQLSLHFSATLAPTLCGYIISLPEAKGSGSQLLVELLTYFQINFAGFDQFVSSPHPPMPGISDKSGRWWYPRSPLGRAQVTQSLYPMFRWPHQ